MKKRTMKVIRSIYKIIQKPQMKILPGQLSFFFVLSLIPLIALLGAIASSFHLSLDVFQEIFAVTIPKEAAIALTNFASGKSIGTNMVIFYISAFILASNGTHSMIIASNSIYKLKDSDYISRRIKALFMTIILVILLVFLIIVPVFGDYIFKLIANAINNDTTTHILGIIYQILKYPTSLIVIFVSIKMLYTIAPDYKVESATTTKGSIFTTIIWIIASEIYSIYIGVFNKYDLFYGSVANILILLLWIYLLSYVFVIGMALNANEYEKKKSLIERIM